MKYKVEYLNVLMFLLHELTFFFFFQINIIVLQQKIMLSILRKTSVFFFVSVLALVLQFFDMHLLTHSESYTLEFH